MSEQWTDDDLISIDECPSCGKHITYAHGDEIAPDVVVCLSCDYSAVKVGTDWVKSADLPVDFGFEEEKR